MTSERDAVYLTPFDVCIERPSIVTFSLHSPFGSHKLTEERVKPVHYLFNSRGRCIAQLVGDRLYSPSGRHVGRYLQSKTIFIDLQGCYLGEIVRGNRLMVRLCSPYRDADFGRQEDHGHIEPLGQPEHLGYVQAPSIYEDVPQERLRRVAERQAAGSSEAREGARHVADEQMTSSSRP